MYRKFPFLFMVLLLMTLFLGSCIEKTDKFSKKNSSVPKVDSVQMRMDALTDSVVALHNNVQELLVLAEAINFACDSISEENAKLSQENVKLKAQLAQARDEVIPAMRMQYEDLYAVQRCAIEEKDEKITSLNNDLWNVNNMNNALTNDRTTLQTELNNLTQWTKKYQHDAKRSFIKVLFNAGKAPIPDVPTPQLE